MWHSCVALNPTSTGRNTNSSLSDPWVAAHTQFSVFSPRNLTGVILVTHILPRVFHLAIKQDPEAQFR